MGATRARYELLLTVEAIGGCSNLKKTTHFCYCVWTKMKRMKKV